MSRATRTMVATLAIVAAVVAGAALARDPAPPRLQSLLTGARQVVAGRVEQVQALDSGRLALATIAVTKTLKGDVVPGARVSVVEIASLPSTPPLVRAGESVLLFLGPARRTSYLRQHLPEGDYLEATSGRDSVLAASDPAVAEEAARIVERLATASRAPEPDAAKYRAARRALVFDQLGARHPALVEEGIAGLGDEKPLQPLSDEEQARLAAVVLREDVPPRVRERLFQQIASLQLASLVPALQDVRSGDPQVVAAAWQALRQLGAAPDAKPIALLLRSSDAKLRSAAARELIARDPAAEVDRAARLALEDPEATVRIAVIEALAQGGSAESIPVLEQAFVEPRLEVRQAASRAIFRIGGRPAQESFARLTFSAPPEMQRYAITMLRATGIADDDPLLVRVRNEHPEPEVREVAEHGLPEGVH